MNINTVVPNGNGQRKVYELINGWEKYWPVIHDGAVRAMANYDRRNYFKDRKFKMTINKSGGWMKDDFFIQFLIYYSDSDDDVGVWYVAMKNFKLLQVGASF